MLAHVRSPACSGKPEEAIDVLRTGLASSSPGTLDGAALLLAWSDVEASRCGHGAAAELAERAAREAAASASGSSQADLPGLFLRLAADDARLRSSLTLGESAGGAEAAAADAAEAACSRTESPSASASAAGMAAVISHVRGDAEAARSAADEVESALRRTKEEREGGGGALALASLAASRAAAVRLASGRADSAVELYSEAVSLAERAAAAASSSAPTSPLATADAAVAALAGRAQARSASALPRPPPPEAEEDATRALSSFDAERDEFSIARPEAAAAPLLLVLGQVFATSGGRVMVAEGLFRRAAQRLKISSSPPHHHVSECVHPSVASALAWRHAQLLTALPKRGTEAEGWAKAAVAVASRSSREQIEKELGTLDALTGKGERGRGAVVDAASRVVLPWLR